MRGPSPSVQATNWRTGIACLLVATLIWAGASVLTQFIYEDLGLHSPFIMTFIANSLFAVYLPLWQLWILLGIIKSNPRFGSITILTQSMNPLQSANQAIKDSHADIQSSLQDGNSAASLSQKSPSKYTHMHAIRAALIIAPLYFLANCLYNYSLYMTSVSSSTIISNLAASFTLLFSWLAGLEKITIPKVGGLLLCFCGAISVGLNDADVPGTLGEGQVQRSLSGDVVALLAAAGYGAYTTLIRLQLPDEESVSMQLVLGYIGAIVFCTLFPVIVILLLLGFERVQWHISWAALGFIVLGGLCDNVFSDYLWARAVVLTSPTVATVGMSITIPFAMLSDLLLQKTKSTPLGSLMGAGLVILGFCLVNVEPETLSAAGEACLESCGWGGARQRADSATLALAESSSSHSMLKDSPEEDQDVCLEDSA